jgi:hypothetical protein
MFVNSASALALPINSANALFVNISNNTKLSSIKDGATTGKHLVLGQSAYWLYSPIPRNI